MCVLFSFTFFLPLPSFFHLSYLLSWYFSDLIWMVDIYLFLLNITIFTKDQAIWVIIVIYLPYLYAYFILFKVSLFGTKTSRSYLYYSVCRCTLSASVLQTYPQKACNSINNYSDSYFVLLLSFHLLLSLFCELCGPFLAMNWYEKICVLFSECFAVLCVCCVVNSYTKLDRRFRETTTCNKIFKSLKSEKIPHKEMAEHDILTLRRK